MELSWLEDFLALVDCASFSRAAKLRHLTQPAFSRRIRALEEWVGAALFDRATHRVALTEAGQRFRPVAEETVRRLYQGREEVRQLAGLAPAALSFAATHVLSLTFFPAWLRALEAGQAWGPIRLVSDSLQACEQIMLQGQVQFLLCHYHPAATGRLDPANFLSLAVGREVLVPVAAPDGTGPRFRLSREAGTPLPLLGYSQESGMGRILRAARITDAAPALDTVFTSHLAAVLRTMALDGRGIAWLPQSLIDADLAAGRLRRAGDAAWEVAIEIRLFRPRARLSDAAEQFWAQAAGSAAA